MATLVLQIPDESLVQKVKQACKMLVGVASVKVQKPTAKKEFDITKTAGARKMGWTVRSNRRKMSSYERSLRDLDEGRVYEYDSLDDLIKEIEG